MHFPIASADSGHLALGLALRKLNASGTFMQGAAHPDDEHDALFAMFTLIVQKGDMSPGQERGRPVRQGGSR